MERWTLKNAFDFIKTERDLIDEVLQGYDGDNFNCSETQFEDICEEVYEELCLKYSQSNGTSKSKSTGQEKKPAKTQRQRRKTLSPR